MEGDAQENNRKRIGDGASFFQLQEYKSENLTGATH